MRLLHLLCGKGRHETLADSAGQKEKQVDVIMPGKEPMNFSSILEQVVRRNKVTHAAILDIQGKVVAVTAGWNILNDDGLALKRLLGISPQRDMWKCTLFKDDFLCMHCEEAPTIMGHSQTVVLVTHMTRKYIVVGMASPSTPGSCLHEMQLVWSEIEKHEN